MLDNDINAIELGFKNLTDFEESIVSSRKINVFDKAYNFNKKKYTLIIINIIAIIILIFEAIYSKLALDIISIPSNFVSIYIVSMIMLLINLIKIKEREDNVSLSNKSFMQFRFNNFGVLVLSKILKPLHLAFYIISSIGSVWNLYYLINSNVNKEYMVISIIIEILCLIINVLVIINVYSFLKKYNKVNYIGRSLKTLKEFDLTYEI